MKFNEKYGIRLVLGILTIFLLIPIFNPQSLIHDNLDSNVVWYKNLAESGCMFGGHEGVIGNLMLGIPRDCYPSEWAIDRMLYLFFDPETAYSINYIIVHLVAFVGMRLFLQQFVSAQSDTVSNFVALAFAMLPFWPPGGLTVAGLPLLCYGLFNIFNRTGKWYHWTIVVIFPFYSAMFFGNMFSFPFLFLVYVIGAMRGNWKISLQGILAFAVLLGTMVWVEQRMIYLVTHNFQSNRVADVQEMDKFMNIKGIIGSSIRAFFLGHYHFHSLQPLIALFSIAGLGYLIFKKEYKYAKWTLAIMAVLFVSALLMVFLDNYDMRSIFGKNYKRMALRLWVYFPMLWYVIFAIVLVAISTTRLKVLVKPMLLIQAVFVMFLLYPYDYFGSRYAENMFANTLIYPHNQEQETFESYYMTDYVGQLKGRNPEMASGPVATLSLSAEILQYNDLRTLEGYYSFYPLEKREMIRQIDHAEREKTTKNLDYHTNRNYLYVNDPEANELPDWDFEKMKSYGVNYLFTDNHIRNAEEKLDIVDSSGPLVLYKIR